MEVFEYAINLTAAPEKNIGFLYPSNEPFYLFH